MFESSGERSFILITSHRSRQSVNSWTNTEHHAMLLEGVRGHLSLCRERKSLKSRRQAPGLLDGEVQPVQQSTDGIQRTQRLERQAFEQQQGSLGCSKPPSLGATQWGLALCTTTFEGDHSGR